MMGEGAWSARELSERCGVSQREVEAHLPHVLRSLAAAGVPVEVAVPHCLGCGFAFVERERVTRPSRCPKCRSERISPPRYRVLATGNEP